MKAIKGNKENVKEIVAALKNGAVLVLPTDTVYGLVCDAENEKVVEKIFKIKKRDKSKPLGIFVKNLKIANKFAFIKKEQENFLKDNHITSILRAKGKRLSKLVYKDGSIGIRIPNYKLLNLILDKFKKPIAQTSANISGKPATVKINDVIEQFSKEDIIIVNAGDLLVGKPSQIIDFTKDTINILRK